MARPRELPAALEVVRDAAILAGEIRRATGSEAFLKSDRSPVTVADFAVQALVAHRLSVEFPDDPLVAEEDSSPLRTADGRGFLAPILDVVRRWQPRLDADRLLSAIDRGAGSPGGRFWTLDPIDGTEGFIRDGQYVVALALVEQGRPEIGILGCPRWAPLAARGDAARVTGALVFAGRGRGAFSMPLADSAEPTPLHVSAVDTPASARVLRSFESRHIDLDMFNRIVEALAVKAPPALMDSQAKHAVLAAGEGDLLLRVPARPDFRDTIWDQAAGTVILEEAGGRVTDLRGAALDFSAGRLLSGNYGVVASNGHLHAAALDAIGRLGGLRHAHDDRSPESGDVIGER